MAARRKPTLKQTQSKLRQSRVSNRSNRSGSPVGKIVVLLVLLGALVWMGAKAVRENVLTLPVFTVRQVVVEGAESLEREKIVTTAGLHPGDNIFRADLREASQALRKAYAAEDFTVFRKLPDTIVIRVQERKPVALINVGKLVGVDSDGIPLPHIGADMVETLPIITGVESVNALSDTLVRARLVEGLKLLEAIGRQAPGVQKRISEVNVSNMSTLGISLIDTGLEVVIGDNGWAEKLPALEKVISQVSARIDTVRTVDMRFGEKIFIRK